MISVLISGVSCSDFNSTVFDLAVKSIVANATLSDTACMSATSESVQATSVVAIPYAAAAKAGKSVNEYVTAMLKQSVSEVSIDAPVLLMLRVTLTV